MRHAAVWVLLRCAMAHLMSWTTNGPLWENWDKPVSGSWPWPERIAIALFVVFVGLIALMFLVFAVVHATGCDC